ncbi:chemotaxis protein CheW [Janthinobacterium sp. 17J80-10]|uniref:chemotaxis protein CheW n=1 Tax=Janthinobacterium sp. 17J80-10 TaxID=2497863 RepID=UPI001005519F|nr:chemotaxis protein CheW [Janthinobacterium sp. 17J80-10]QAU33139.1 chemotaxis protein CheW [Janthinobacterium sp. 17J80-10]
MDSFQSDIFLPYMRDVMRCEQSMQGLNQMWRMIESTARMNCTAEAQTILPTMAATRSSLDKLEQELVACLAGEKVANVLDEIGTKAQYVIDIVVRNLYERTADIGFLATDHELCAFVAGLQDDRDAVLDRLRAYRNKYTVYDEIILLNPQGKVLAHIDRNSSLEYSADALIAQSLASDAYVETFRASDLQPRKERALIYSKRMMHPQTHAVAGVLCLCFSFEEEMASIFRTHGDPRARANMLLLDGDNRVIASANPRWIPVGDEVPVNPAACPEPVMYGGRAYLARTVSAAGYQGYMGPPGWQGQVMIPVDVAFVSTRKHEALAMLEPAMAEGLLAHASSFCPQLHDIMRAAEGAAETIRRVVWNGQVMTAGRHGELLKLKTVLGQISETGTASNKLFAQSIRDLYETVLASNLNNAEFIASLLVDLLDRNLYERADDCRWWALTPELRAALAAPQRSEATVAQLHGILDYINKLYTVYTRIFVYDRSGTIIASTNAPVDGESVIGASIDERTLERVLALNGEQQYHATPFEASALYGHDHTYIYHAAIRHPEQAALAVGGIGIVFDATVEFSAMLRGALPDPASMSAFFIDRAGSVIASTDAARPVGTQLAIDPALLALENGRSAARIVVHDGSYAIMGCTVSNGYREFKRTDGYREDVLGVVFHTLGAATGNGIRTSRPQELAHVPLESGDAREFATFLIDGDLFAVAAENVLEAVPAANISPVSVGARQERIGILTIHGDEGSRDFAWVFDLGYLVRGKASVTNDNSPVIIIRRGTQTIGVLVNELHGVPEFSVSALTPTPLLPGTDGMLVPWVIKAGSELIQVVDADYLFRLLTAQEAPMLAYG